MPWIVSLNHSLLFSLSPACVLFYSLSQFLSSDQQIIQTRSVAMGARTTTTVFVNNTVHSVKMQVGNNHFFSDLTSIQQGGQFKLDVNVNDTYREFAVSRAGSRKKEIVSSDDCCEFQCITIQEMADGTIDLVRQPRETMRSTASASKTPF